MRELLILLLIGGVAYLGYDDYIKRDALKQAQQDIQRLSLGQPATASRAAGRPAVSVWNPATPGWLQDRLSERPAMDSAVRHKQTGEDTTKSSPYGSPKPH
jgi:hypothetical protein